MSTAAEAQRASQNTKDFGQWSMFIGLLDKHYSKEHAAFEQSRGIDVTYYREWKPFDLVRLFHFNDKDGVHDTGIYNQFARMHNGAHMTPELLGRPLTAAEVQIRQQAQNAMAYLSYNGKDWRAFDDLFLRADALDRSAPFPELLRRQRLGQLSAISPDVASKIQVSSISGEQESPLPLSLTNALAAAQAHATATLSGIRRVA